MRVAIISLALLFIAACNNNKDADKKNPSGDNLGTKTENTIVGVWRPVEIGMEMTEDEKKDLMGKASIEFTTNGSYISHFREDKETGTYTYDPAAKTLSTTGPDSGQDNFTVVWEDGLLKLTSIKGDGTMVLKRK